MYPSNPRIPLNQEIHGDNCTSRWSKFGRIHFDPACVRCVTFKGAFDQLGIRTVRGFTFLRPAVLVTLASRGLMLKDPGDRVGGAW